MAAGWSAVAAFAQGGSISGQVISPAGYPVAFASVRICPVTSTGTPCTPLTPNIFADPPMAVPAANPYTTDGFGNYSVFVPAGSYYLVQVSFTSNLQPYIYTYLVAAASSSIAIPAPQYSIATYTAPGTGATLGESFVDPANGQLRTDAAGGLYVAGGANFYGPISANALTATAITGTTINALSQFQVNGGQIAAVNLANGVNGSGAIVLSNSPTLITPNIGVAAGVSLNVSGNLTATGNAAAALVNSTTGYQFNGLAPANHILLGNGTKYVDSATIPTTAVTGLEYQTVSNAGTNLAQQPILNFDGTVIAYAGTGKTSAGLPATGTAGTYTNPVSLTTDAQGRVTAAVSGQPGITYDFLVPGCAPTSSTDSGCTGSIALPTAYPDAAYFPVLTVNSINGAFLSVSVSGVLLAGSIPYTITCTFNCGTIVTPTIYVHTHHN